MYVAMNEDTSTVRGFTLSFKDSVLKKTYNTKLINEHKNI